VNDAEQALKILSLRPNAVFSETSKFAHRSVPIGSGILANNKENGLIRVTYVPEKSVSVHVTAVSGKVFSFKVQRNATLDSIKEMLPEDRR
jgi:hypothetical protein